MKIAARAALLSLLSLAACAVPERPPTTESVFLWQERQTRLQAYDAWDLRGRIAVRVGDEGGQASLRWLRASGRNQLDLGSPLGQGVLHFKEDATGAHAQDAKGRIRSAADLPTLVLQLTGWRIPVASLEYWIRGLPAPNQPSVPVLDEAGRMRALEQGGWRVRITDYFSGQALDLPRRLFLNYPGDNSGVPPIDLRLVIDSWAS